MAIKSVKSEIAGVVIEILMNVGDHVNQGDEIMLIESMKMEIPVIAEFSGIIASIECAKGSDIVESQEVATIEC